MVGSDSTTAPQLDQTDFFFCSVVRVYKASVKTKGLSVSHNRAAPKDPLNEFFCYNTSKERQRNKFLFCNAQKEEDQTNTTHSTTPLSLSLLLFVCVCVSVQLQP